jgi:hypothetical protein
MEPQNVLINPDREETEWCHHKLMDTYLGFNAREMPDADVFFVLFVFVLLFLQALMCRL